MFNNWLSREKKALICSVCCFPWCKYSHHGQLQAVNVMLLNVELERDACVGSHEWVMLGCSISLSVLLCRLIHAIYYTTKPHITVHFSVYIHIKLDKWITFGEGSEPAGGEDVK